jgi:hypothetical protein
MNFYILKICILPTKCICVFRMILTLSTALTGLSSLWGRTYLLSHKKISLKYYLYDLHGSRTLRLFPSFKSLLRTFHAVVPN